ncbi:MAG: GTPase Era [Sedimenticola sp.]|jgi:GTP-binding protein Era|nr:MAG: GTPase Era [Sedimenticola sp.]
MNEKTTNRCGYCAIVGRPNVGKSTLLNAIVGQKLAITSKKPQTTRHSILGVKTLDGGQIIFVDTPGIHQRGDQPMNRYLNRTAKTMLADVDVILFLVEAERWQKEDEGALEAVKKTNKPVILLINKIDNLKNKEDLLPFMEMLSSLHSFSEIIPISAKRETGIIEVENSVLARLPNNPNIFPDDQLTDRPERFFAAELIREQITRRYAKEIPYSVTVEIEKFEEEGNLYRINALIWVEREGQKKIIIGQKGEALKEVGRLSRIEMEKMFDKKVFLTVWIKVKKSWSSDESALTKLGYFD